MSIQPLDSGRSVHPYGSSETSKSYRSPFVLQDAMVQRAGRQIPEHISHLTMILALRREHEGDTTVLQGMQQALAASAESVKELTGRWCTSCQASDETSPVSAAVVQGLNKVISTLLVIAEECENSSIPQVQSYATEVKSGLESLPIEVEGSSLPTDVTGLAHNLAHRGCNVCMSSADTAVNLPDNVVPPVVNRVLDVMKEQILSHLARQVKHLLSGDGSLSVGDDEFRPTLAILTALAQEPVPAVALKPDGLCLSVALPEECGEELREVTARIREDLSGVQSVIEELGGTVEVKEPFSLDQQTHLRVSIMGPGRVVSTEGHPYRLSSLAVDPSARSQRPHQMVELPCMVEEGFHVGIAVPLPAFSKESSRIALEEAADLLINLAISAECYEVFAFHPLADPQPKKKSEVGFKGRSVSRRFAEGDFYLEGFTNAAVTPEGPGYMSVPRSMLDDDTLTHRLLDLFERCDLKQSCIQFVATNGESADRASIKEVLVDLTDSLVGRPDKPRVWITTLPDGELRVHGTL